MSTLDQIAEADTCNAPTLDICNVNLEDCVTAHASQPAAICECRGAHTACVQNAGCSTATVSAVVGVCEESGCLAKQVRGSCPFHSLCGVPLLPPLPLPCVPFPVSPCVGCLP